MCHERDASLQNTGMKSQKHVFLILDLSTQLFAEKYHLNLCELGDMEVDGDEATGVPEGMRKSTKVCGFFFNEKTRITTKKSVVFNHFGFFSYVSPVFF